MGEDAQDKLALLSLGEVVPGGPSATGRKASPLDGQRFTRDLHRRIRHPAER